MSTGHHNPNVLNILLLTTLRTIDLEGKKNSDPLFSGFCAEERDFFEGNAAPKCVHANSLGVASTRNKTVRQCPHR